MKKTKQTLAFEQLEAEMELISRSEQLTFSGGTGGTAQDLVNAMSSSGQSYYGASSNSNYDYSSGGYTYGSNGQPSSSYYGSNSNSNSSNGYSSNSYSSNSYSSNSSNGYSSNGYSSAGYSSSGYGFNTGTSPIELDTVTVHGQANSNSGFGQVFKEFWNSPVMRAIVPDLIGYNISVSGVLGGGAGKTYSINLVTRGQASLSITQTQSLRLGLHADASINGSAGWYLGEGSKVSLDSFLGLGVDGAVDGRVIGGSAWTSNDNTGTPTWLGFSGGGGPAAGGSVGVGNTVVLQLNGIPMRINF